MKPLKINIIAIINKIIIHNNNYVGVACVQPSALDSDVSFLNTLDV